MNLTKTLPSRMAERQPTGPSQSAGAEIGQPGQLVNGNETAIAAPRPAGGQAVVRLRGVRRSFGQHVVLDGIDLEVQAGEFVSILGKSGTGKSTLLRALDGFDGGVTGYIEVPERRAVVYQDARLLPWARVLDNVVLGLPGKKVKEQARSILGEVNLATHQRAWPVTLSGGEAQRVALARALIRDPHLLLLDEPFGALDALTRITMHGLLRALCDRYNPAVLLVTHDVNEAITLSDRIVVLDGGKVVHDEQIMLTNPREAHHPAFASLRHRLHEKLGVFADATETTTDHQPAIPQRKEGNS